MNELRVYPKNFYQSRKTLFDKLFSFGIEYKKEQMLTKNLAMFEFISICVQVESFKKTDTTENIAKFVPISVLIS